MNKEILFKHIRNLEEEHLILDSQIKENHSHFVNDLDLSKMKYQRLQLKREIETLKQKYNETQATH
jgi:hypothetical protein